MLKSPKLVLESLQDSSRPDLFWRSALPTPCLKAEPLGLQELGVDVLVEPVPWGLLLRYHAREARVLCRHQGTTS